MHLHVTNGDAAAGHLRLLVGAAPVLAWRDVLHQGPVPAGLGRIELSAVRATFIASCGWAPLDEALAAFRRRDGLIAAPGPADRITLWFEHDLYDQLQLVEVPDALADLLLPPAAIGLVQAGVYLTGLSVAEPATLRTGGRPVGGCPRPRSARRGHRLGGRSRVGDRRTPLGETGRRQHAERAHEQAGQEVGGEAEPEAQDHRATPLRAWHLLQTASAPSVKAAPMARPFRAAAVATAKLKSGMVDLRIGRGRSFQDSTPPGGCAAPALPGAPCLP